MPSFKKINQSPCHILKIHQDLSDLIVPKTSGFMVVHHTRRLHVRIDHGTSDELKAPFLEVFADGIGKRGIGRGILVI